MKEIQDSLDVLMLAGYLPPVQEYATIIRHFPGSYAHSPWGNEGLFLFSVDIFDNGLQVGHVQSEVCTEQGYLQAELGTAHDHWGLAENSIFIMQYRHAKEIPVDVYAFHIHRKTGTYISSNLTPFIGEKLFPTCHTDQMENTLFWPGVISNEENETVVTLINPYNLSLGVQVHLIASSGEVTLAPPINLKSHTTKTLNIADLFPQKIRSLREGQETFSLCLAGQYKLVACIMIKNRSENIISMMDHLHTYCLR